MFKKSIILTIFCFFFPSITTSLIKNKARNLEKDISKIRKNISFLEKQISDAEIDFVYLSNPERVEKHLIDLNKNKYSTFDSSRIFFSLKHFTEHNLKESKYQKKNILND